MSANVRRCSLYFAVIAGWRHCGHASNVIHEGFTCCAWPCCAKGGRRQSSSSLVFMLCQNYGHSRGGPAPLRPVQRRELFSDATRRLCHRSYPGARRSLSAGMALLACGYAVLTIPSPSALWPSASPAPPRSCLFGRAPQVVMALLYERQRPTARRCADCCLLGDQRRCHRRFCLCRSTLRSLDFRAAFTLAAAVLLVGTLAVFLGKSVLRLRHKQLSPSVSAPMPR